MSDPKRISPKEAAAKMAEGYAYVDVRTEAEFAAGHPKGAWNVPLMLAGPGGMTLNPEFGAVMAANFTPSSKIVVGCKAGARSRKAAEQLAARGFTDVLDQRAGWDGARDPFGQVLEAGWSSEGLPTATASEAGHAYAYLQKKAPR